MKIKLREITGRRAFGYTRWEAVDYKAKTFTNLMRRKTFTKDDIIWIKELGFKVEYEYVEGD